MVVTLKRNGIEYQADLSKPHHISIPLIDGLENQPNAFGAPLYEARPVVSGDFIGSIEQGASVNFYNVRVNPHGNGTHTESIGHITAGGYAIHEVLAYSHYIAEVVSVHPMKRGDGDRVVTAQSLQFMVEHEDVDALIVRTLPNPESKKVAKYTGTNPPYFAPGAMEWIGERGYQHLLTDLPSVDREEDGGKLESHREFWKVSGNQRTDRTITEMVYVANYIEDGLYLLNLQIAPLALDASPSRPVLFKLTKES